MTAVIYARYSSDSQREASIEGQLRDCKDYAEKNGITVVGTYIDRAYSAKTDDRPDFQRMIKDSAKKIFDVVLVWKLDRFARNRFDAVNYKYQLEKNGVHLVSAMEPISQGPEGIMVESMLIGMAEYYSAELALKVARGERENALQCKYNGGIVPLGFTIGKEDRLYHIDPETAPIVQEIFSRYADGEPAEKIAASLNERGLRTRTGKPFVKNSFFQIFRNRRYIGEYRYKDIVTPGGIPAIVDQDLFDRVQQRFEQNRIAHGRPAKEDVSYLLTTKLFCGKCGTLMGGESGTSHMGNTYYYYKCGNAKRHGKAHCDLKAIRKEPLERFVVNTAIKVIFSDEIIERLIDLVMEAQQKENTRLPVLKDQLRDTEKRLANLLEAIEQGILTPTTKQRLDELEARKEALNTSILEEELKKPVLTREWIRFWLEKFRKGDVGSTEHQRQIIDTFVNSVYVFDDRVVLNFNFTDDAKTVTREEVLGSSAVDNAPPQNLRQLSEVFCFGGESETRTARPRRRAQPQCSPLHAKPPVTIFRSRAVFALSDVLQLNVLAVLHDVVEHLLHGGGHGGRPLDSQTYDPVFLRLDGVDLDGRLAVPQQHLRHDGDAQAGFHHGNVGLVIDDMAAALGADLIFLEELPHLSIGGVALHDEALAVHLSRGHHIVRRIRPVLRHDAQQRLPEQLGQAEFLFAGGGQECNVDLTGAQPLLDVIVSSLIYFNLDLRILCRKAFEQARQQRGAHRVERAQLHLAFFQTVQAGNALLERLITVEHRADGRVQRSAVTGHGHAVFAAVEQCKAQFFLHNSNGVADGRRSQMQLLCRFVKAALPRHCIENLVGKKRHAQSLLPLYSGSETPDSL